jgi:hypothetical protein
MEKHELSASDFKLIDDAFKALLQSNPEPVTADKIKDCAICFMTPTQAGSKFMMKPRRDFEFITSGSCPDNPALGGKIAQQRRGAADRGEHRQAAGAFAQVADAITGLHYVRGGGAHTNLASGASTSPVCILDIAMLLNLLSKAATVAMLCFVLSSMLAMGAGLTLARIIESLRNVRLVFLALLANFVLMPAESLLTSAMMTPGRSANSSQS